MNQPIIPEKSAPNVREPIPIVPLLARHADAAAALGLGFSAYFKLIREGRIKSVGKGRMSRAVYASLVQYVAELVAEAETETKAKKAA